MLNKTIYNKNMKIISKKCLEIFIMFLLPIYGFIYLIATFVGLIIAFIKYKKGDEL